MTTKPPSKTKFKKNYHHGDLPSELLSAAEIELSEKGLEAFSLRSVAKRASVSHGAPSHHFKDLNGLLTALAAQGYERLLAAQIERQRHAKTDPISQSIASGLAYISFATENPALFRLMFSSEKPDRNDENFARISIATFDRLINDIQNRLETDPYADPDAMKQVIASWAMVHGLAELMISGRTERPLELSKMTASEQDTILSEILMKIIPPIK